MANIIEHSQFGEVRVEKRGDNHYFCAKDVCEVLGLNNTAEAIRGLDNDEITSFMVKVKCVLPPHVAGVRTSDTCIKNQEVTFVTESGLYALIIRSYKPAARKFRK